MSNQQILEKWKFHMEWPKCYVEQTYTEGSLVHGSFFLEFTLSFTEWYSHCISGISRASTFKQDVNVVERGLF